MKVEEIERLLAGFYEGNTTESQEEALKDYFREEVVPEHLQKEKELFLGFFCRETVAEETPAELEDKLSRLIDEKADEEQLFFHRNKSKRNWRWVGGIAATVLLLIGIGYGTGNFGMRSSVPQDTFSDPEVAYEVLQATLLEVSTNLNEGIEQVNNTQDDVAKINKQVMKEFKK